jgi:hypothetical protein
VKLNGVITQNTIIFTTLNLKSHLLNKIATHHSTCLATCSGYYSHANCVVIWSKINWPPYKCVFTHTMDQVHTATNHSQWWQMGPTVLISIFTPVPTSTTFKSQNSEEGTGHYTDYFSNTFFLLYNKNNHISRKFIPLLYGCLLYCLQLLLQLPVKSQ